MWQAFLTWWGRYKNVQAVRGLLQWIGVWDWGVRWCKRVIGGLVAAALTLIWSRVIKLPGPFQFVLALASFALMLLIITAFLHIRDRYRESLVGTGDTRLPDSAVPPLEELPAMPQSHAPKDPYQGIIKGVFDLPMPPLSDKECRLEWSEAASRSSLLRFFVWNATPNSMPCTVRLVDMQRWSDIQSQFIEVDAAMPPYNFIVFDGMVAPEVRKAKDLVEATETGFKVLEVKRDRNRHGSQLGRWKLDFKITLGQRERDQSLEFEWTTTGLSLPKAAAESELVETHYDQGAIIGSPAPGRLEIQIERRGDRWIGKLRNKGGEADRSLPVKNYRRPKF